LASANLDPIAARHLANRFPAGAIPTLTIYPKIDAGLCARSMHRHLSIVASIRIRRTRHGAVSAALRFAQYFQSKHRRRLTQVNSSSQTLL
jgi:hypothetical protein